MKLRARIVISMLVLGAVVGLSALGASDAPAIPAIAPDTATPALFEPPAPGPDGERFADDPFLISSPFLTAVAPCRLCPAPGTCAPSQHACGPVEENCNCRKCNGIRDCWAPN